MDEDARPGPEPDDGDDGGHDAGPDDAFAALTQPPEDTLAPAEPDEGYLNAGGGTYGYDYENDVPVDDHDYNDDYWDQQ